MSPEYKTIGLVLPSADLARQPYYVRAEQTLKKATSEQGFNLVLYTEDDVISRTSAPTPAGKDAFKCDGLVLYSPLKDWETYVKTLSGWQLPCVLVRRRSRLPGVYSVYDDDRQGTKKALEHLLNLGHETIGYVGRWENDPLGRKEAYCEFMREKGIAINERFIFGEHRFKGTKFNTRVNNLRTWVKGLISAKACPSAFFCYSDEVGVYMINCLMMLKKRVPQDVALVSYTDDDTAKNSRPALTSLHIPVEEMCEKACQILVGLTRGNTIKETEIQLPNELVIRESCGHKQAR